MYWIVLLVLLLVSGKAMAQDIYRCNNAGSLSYQAAPCAEGRGQKWVPAQPVLPDDPSLAQQSRQTLDHMRRQWQLEADQRRKASVVRHPASVRRTPSVSECEKAREKRRVAYERLGLKRNFAQSSYWDNVVASACK